MAVNQTSTLGNGETRTRRGRRRRATGARTGAATGLGADVNVSGGANINPSLLTGRERQIWDRAYAVGTKHGCEFMGGTVPQGTRAKL
jgi:hypothetical protein